MGKNGLASIGLVIFFSVAVPALFLENEQTLAAGFRQNNPAQSQKTHAASTPKEIFSILDHPHSPLTQVRVENLLIKLFELQKASIKHYESIIFSDDFNARINRYPLEDLTSLHIKDPDLKSLLQEILDNGFKLSSSEGMVYIESDYPQFFRKYRYKTTAKMARYLRIMAEEMNRHFAEDAALMITPNTLSERIIQIDSFIEAFPNFARNQDLKTLRNRYLPAYLLGLNNTPAFSYHSNQIDEKFLKSYQRTANHFPDSELANLTEAYLNVLLKNHYTKTPDVLKFVKDVLR